MLFPSLEFVLFFLLVLGGVWLLKGNRQRKGLLLVASYYFYAYWDWRFLGLIILSTLVDFFVGRSLAGQEDPRHRKALLCVSLAVNLGMLFFFKYCNFFIDSARPLLEAAWFDVGTLDIILPVGISFYTFQTLSYTIDVYRRKLEHTENLLDFALFVGFFPQLVAGPIVRAAHFLPQLAVRHDLNRADLFAGFQRFAQGLFKKVILADRLAMGVDHLFANAGAYDSLTCWTAVVGYALQLYFDFSGYSDMAIGAARMLGYDLGENFDYPYKASSPSDFWRRWHISLSTWVRDYLYIPLGGSRKGTGRTYVNLLVAMTLCGLWHGASWNFVLWGLVHGLALAAHRLWRTILPQEPGRLGTALGWGFTQLVWVASMALFRSQDLASALTMYSRMLAFEGGLTWIYWYIPAVAAGTVAVYALEQRGVWQGVVTPESPRWFTPTFLCSLLWTVVVFYPRGFTPFVYFQF